ncbi:hypothetical protein FRB90_003475 [Tulasnella sp. 427]|nr:hypothetical protein FRB90_003475 [Tulasnella sp. 427]
MINVLDIMLRPDIIAVARNISIDLYDPCKLPKNTEPWQSSNVLPVMTFTDSFSYPCPPSFRLDNSTPVNHHVKFIPQSPEGLGAQDEKSILISVHNYLGWTIHEFPCQQDENTSSGPRFLPPRSTYRAGSMGFVMRLAWGQSSALMAILKEEMLIVYFRPTLSKGDPLPLPGLNDSNSDQEFAVWMIPCGLEDIPRCVSLDEATGIVVVGMASGQVLVADAGASVLPSPTTEPVMEDRSQYDWDFSPDPSLEIPENPPHPSAKQWEGFANNPAMHDPLDIDLPDGEVAPGWSQDVDSYYPSVNEKDYYYSIPWLIRDLAGIPSGARCILVSTEPDVDLYGAFIELNVEVWGGGRYFLLTSDIYEHDWDLYKCRRDITANNIVEHLRAGRPAMELSEGNAWNLDPVAAARYRIHELRRQSAEKWRRSQELGMEVKLTEC